MATGRQQDAAAGNGRRQRVQLVLGVGVSGGERIVSKDVCQWPLLPQVPLRVPGPHGIVAAGTDHQRNAAHLDNRKVNDRGRGRYLAAQQHRSDRHTASVIPSSDITVA